MKIKLRGHHLLCLQGFQGYAYDDSFVKNMTYINNLENLKIQLLPLQIKLTISADAVQI